MRAVESMLLVAPNQLLLLAALGGRIGRSCRSDRGCGIQWKFHRVVWKRYSNTTGLEGLVGPSGYCCWCSCLHSQFESKLWALEIDPDASAGDPNRIDSNGRRGVLYFKGHSTGSGSVTKYLDLVIFFPCYTYIQTVIFSFTESTDELIWTSSSRYWICIL